MSRWSDDSALKQSLQSFQGEVKSSLGFLSDEVKITGVSCNSLQETEPLGNAGLLAAFM